MKLICNKSMNMYQTYCTSRPMHNFKFIYIYHQSVIKKHFAISHKIHTWISRLLTIDLFKVILSRVHMFTNHKTEKREFSHS
jgi:hypothetical protein